MLYQAIGMPDDGFEGMTIMDILAGFEHITPADARERLKTLRFDLLNRIEEMGKKDIISAEAFTVIEGISQMALRRRARGLPACPIDQDLDGVSVKPWEIPKDHLVAGESVWWRVGMN